MMIISSTCSFLVVFSSMVNCLPQIVGQNHHVHKRGSPGSCAFPTESSLVAVTPNEKNGGWALHADTACTPGNYCPYACLPGKLMAQWDPSSTTYSYPESQYGGLLCSSDGTVSKPFTNKDYCIDGKGTVQVNNTAGSNVAFCQTVLPGNEEMLIPTDVANGILTTLAVPGTDYWASTAAHYYVNPPGVPATEGCIWGSTANPYGNWSPYVAGANMDENGNTYVKIGWNPKYLDDFSTKLPEFGIRITCDDETKCNGLTCEIDPSKGVNEVSGPLVSTGAGNAKFCVVTSVQSSIANIEVFPVGNTGKKKRDINSNEVSQLFDDSVSKGVNFTNTSGGLGTALTSGSSVLKINFFIVPVIIVFYVLALDM